MRVAVQLDIKNPEFPTDGRPAVLSLFKAGLTKYDDGAFFSELYDGSPKPKALTFAIGFPRGIRFCKDKILLPSGSHYITVTFSSGDMRTAILLNNALRRCKGKARPLANGNTMTLTGLHFPPEPRINGHRILVKTLSPIIVRVLGEALLPQTGEEYPHNYLSPAFLDTDFFKQQFGKNQAGRTALQLLVKVIFYHHAREAVNSMYGTGLKKYIEEVLEKRWDELKNICVMPETAGLAQHVNTRYWVYVLFTSEDWLDDGLQERYMKLKGMLNRIDYCASAGVPVEDTAFDADGKTYTQKTVDFMRKSGFAMHPVQQYLKNHSGENVIVQASTGCGKTEGALLWLNGEKGFYTLPLKASINAIYKRLTDGAKIGYRKTAVLHSDAKALYLDAADQSGEQALQKFQLARLFTAPLTVCTVDQLFRFVYKANGTEIAAAALSCGNLVIDEIQMYSPELIASILYALHLISDMGGHFCIMTATFPKVLLHLMKVYQIPCPGRKELPNFHGSLACRHRISLLKSKNFPLEQICRQAQTKRVLVLVNRVAAAQTLQQQLADLGVEAQVLHSRFLRRDRRTLEQKIMAFAPNELSRPHRHGVWISTQVVEASLDLDFDVLYTELCTIDSLLQRMGRVYRNRAYDLGDEPNVYVLPNEDCGSARHRIVDKRLYEFSLAAVRKFNGCLLQESDGQDDKAEMMDMVYDPDCNPEILESNYYKSICNKYKALSDGCMYELEKNEAAFRDIDSVTVMPQSIYEQLAESGKLSSLQEKMRRGSREECVMAQEKLLDYTVSVPNMGLDIDHNPVENDKRFFLHSGVCLYHGAYDFDETTGQGNGLLMQFKNDKNKEEFDNVF